MPPRTLFAFDQNYPVPIIETFNEYILEAELIQISKIDPRMARIDDWEILVALKQDARPWAGIITNDTDFMQPRELMTLMKTGLSLVFVERVGHDPLKASGLLLTHLPAVCRRLRPGVPQVWRLSAAERRPEDPWTHFSELAARRKVTTALLKEQASPSDEEMIRSPLERITL